VDWINPTGAKKVHALIDKVYFIGGVRANPFFHSASDQLLRSRPGSWRQNRSGRTAIKPCAATSSHVLRMSVFTPNASCRTTTAGANEELAVRTAYGDLWLQAALSWQSICPYALS
jgi:hypothetical protein